MSSQKQELSDDYFAIDFKIENDTLSWENGADIDFKISDLNIRRSEVPDEIPRTSQP